MRRRRAVARPRKPEAPPAVQRRNLVIGCAALALAGIVAFVALRATWWTVTEPGRSVPVPGSATDAVVGERVERVSGADRDGTVGFAAVGMILLAAGAALTAPSRRLPALVVATLASIYVAMGSSTVLSNRRRIAALEDFSGSGRIVSDPTAAPMVAIVAGLAGVVAAVYTLRSARSAPRLGMPEGPPPEDEQDKGVWE